MGRAIVATAVLVTALLACGGDDDGASSAAASSRCDEPQLQPAQFPAGHVLPGQPEPRYLSEPPTSGPHAPVAEVAPVYDAPVARPTQVGILETGRVLIQYQGGLPADQIDRLRSLAGGHIVVAPASELDRPVVASAWLRLLRCDAVDEEALRDFVGDRAGKGPDGHGH
jgi:hypothetical protein